jgi:hypothetical protein
MELTMAFIVSIILPFLKVILEGGEGEPPIPVYKLLDMYWWAALLLLSLIIFVVWLLITWQSKYFDGQLQLSVTHMTEPHGEAIKVPVVSSPAEWQVAQQSFEVLPTDDLTLIEGIGPVISRLLQSKGITTFAQLAQADRQDLDRFMKRQSTSGEHQHLVSIPAWQEAGISKDYAPPIRLKGARKYNF